jgi:serine/threonine protein kinase
MNENTCGLPSRFKGVKGMLVDTCCETPQRNKSLAPYDLCNILESPLTESIDLVAIHSTKTLEFRRVSSVVLFSKYLSKHKKDLAVKYYFREKDKDEELIQDLLGSLLLRQIYTEGKHFHKDYLTMNYQLQFNEDTRKGELSTGFPFQGLRILHNNRFHYYFISNRCQKTLDDIERLSDRSFQKLVSDFLQSFVILHGKDYYHGDVKLQNMMYCPKKDTKITYKLIDWGRLRSVKDFDKGYFYGGSKQCGSPLGFYYLFRNQTKGTVGYQRAIDLSFALFEGKLPKNPIKSPLFLEFPDKFIPLWTDIKKSFRLLIESYKQDDSFFSRGRDSDVMIFNDYKFTLDLYNFGLVILYLVYKHNLNQSKYLPFIKKLVIYSPNMIRTADEALREWKRLNKHSQKRSRK